MDVKKRIERVLFELERQRNHVIVISHKAGTTRANITCSRAVRIIADTLAVLRCLYSYFMQIESSATPTLPFPLHTVVVLRPSLLGMS